MQKVADLHLHTVFSDGTFSPDELVDYARLKGIDAISITDHDSCDAISLAIKRGNEIGIEVIPGVELTSEIGENEIHILGYFIDWGDLDFIKRLEDISTARKERAVKILERLKKAGINLDIDELFDTFKCKACVGRLHIARLMVKKGNVGSIQEAFYRYIGNKGPCYVKSPRLLPEEAIDIIKQARGITVLAHPRAISIDNRILEDILEILIRAGIQGIEVFHPEHDEADINIFKELADRHRLLITGGSDCHGLAKKEILIGRVTIPYELVEKLRIASVGSYECP